MSDMFDFHAIATDEGWSHTSPMMWSDDPALQCEIAPSPWYKEMLGAPAIIELVSGQVIRCHLLTWDAVRRECRYEAPPRLAESVLPLSQVRMVSLTRRCQGGAFEGDERGVPMRSEAPVRFQLAFTDGTALRGVTLGRIERPEGHYLARRVGVAGNTVRLFVPHSAIDHTHFDEICVDDRNGAGRGLAPVTRFEPVRTKAQLYAAVSAQAVNPVMRLGDVLLRLGLVTHAQLDAAMACPDGEADMPLGERLVHAGVVSSGAMQRALHMKMGYPVVDVRRFPVDPAALECLPYARASDLQVLPVAFVDGHIVVVMTDPGRIKVLEELKFLLDAAVVPALPWNDPVEVVLPEAYGVCDIRRPGRGWFG